MNIVVVDGYTMNPGDLDWSPLRALGENQIYERTAPSEVIERCRDAEMVITNKVVFDREIIARLPRLQYLGVSATGVNIIDLEAARERGITVTNVPGYSTASVAQAVFAHLLNLTLQTARHAQAVRDGVWSNSPDFCFWQTPLIELAGLTMGIVGFGKIGRAAANIAHAFGMRVLFTTTGSVDAPAFARQVELKELLQSSDVVTLHCPLTPQTHHLINRETLALMKPGAFLINTGRGPLVDELALAEALNSGVIAGAGLDVLSVEPPSPDNPLVNAHNCCITPHIAWATRAARQRLLNVVVENIAAFIQGTPINVVL